MISRSKQLVFATVAALTIAAVVAIPANATITASASGGRITASSRNTAFTRSGLGVRCTTSTFSGTVAADGRSLSGELDFNNASRTTCSGTFGVSCEFRSTAPTTITSRSTTSTAGVSALLDLVLDSSFTLNINCLAGGLVCTISGPQTIRGAETIRQGSPSPIIVDGRGIRCTEGGTIDFAGTYTINERISIS